MQSKGPVKLKIDGHEVSISPLKPKYSPDDKDLFSQRTTIYDAAQKLYVEVLKEEEVPVPILCHQQHMKPVGVCRACLVELTATDRNGNKRTSLVPACYLPVAGGMEISTLKSSERIARIVRTVVELLQSDYQRPSLADGRTMPENELDRIGRMIQARENHYPRTSPDRGEDDSSPIIQVDHNACILCDRCVRACTEIRSNFVIGRMGKGYQTRIAFDDDQPMGESSCVALRRMYDLVSDGRVDQSAGHQHRDGSHAGTRNRDRTGRRRPGRVGRNRGGETPMSGLKTSPAKGPTVKRKIRPGPVPAAELCACHPDLFGDMSERFLDWNFGAVVRRHYRDGEIICRQGEYGSTAFIIEYGKVEVRIKTSGSADDAGGGIFSKIFGFLSPGGKSDTASSRQVINLSDAPVTLRYGDPVTTMDRLDRIFGEMACMNNYPRSATIRGGATSWCSKSCATSST
ncbi:MAG: 2Fe-2S iron-sulfur cluster-binding protein [Pirellulales bacterium]